MNYIPFWPTTKPIPKPKDMPKIISVSDFLAIDSGDGTTGLIFQGFYLPEEILRIILSCLDTTSLLKCRAVCKYWRHEVDNEVWKYKLRREQGLTVNAVNLIANSIPNSWFEFYAIATKQPFNKNLLANNCGQDELNCWEMLSNGGDKWLIESPPVGSDNLPDEVSCAGSSFCFVTSYHSCSKRQTILLQSIGLTPRIMDIIQPNVYICEWYARRFDSGAVYEMKVQLLDIDRAVLKEFEYRITLDVEHGTRWYKVSHEFKNYGPGVRYVMFYHGGTDTQFWAGHYGSKMTGACLKVHLSTESTIKVTKNFSDEPDLLNDD